ncbi:hypothetical protein [Amycolatopsis palatopharyngis]|uniref:hypothetical protein n=1 Tax=Amycolatopsis palatopharyngis TaxID=187982 RepID=UPI0013BE980C|nr:hypothetical protein [Amycolatopsis palatopharyngis]
MITASSDSVKSFFAQIAPGLEVPESGAELMIDRFDQNTPSQAPMTTTFCSVAPRSGAA